MRNKKTGGLDYFRVAAAFLVVAIHTSPLASFDGEADFIFTRITARVAVPFFLMVTGYFLMPRYLFGKSGDVRPLSGYVRKTLLLYAAAVLIYLPVNVYAGQFKDAGIGDILRMVVFDGTFYHLWYLPAAVTGVLLVWLLSRVFRLPVWAVGCITLCLYLIGLFGDSYYGWIENTAFVRERYEGMFRFFSYTRNGFFYVPVFLFLGAWISQGRKAGKRTVDLAGLVLSFALMTGEGLMLHRMGMQRHDSMYIALLPCMFFLFRILLSVKAEPAGHLRAVSMWIYLIHPFVIIVVRGGAKAVHLETLFIDNSIVHYLTVCALSCLLAVCIGKLTPRRETGAGRAAGDGKGTGTGKKAGKERAWIELNRHNLHQNITLLQELLPAGCRLMPVIKANAYGHGAVLMAKELNFCGITSFCTATVTEAVELRKKGIKGEILILGYTHPEQFPLLRRYHLVQTVVDSSYAKMLREYGKKVKVHLKIDTGMHRLGERCENINALCRIFRYKNLIIEGAYTHLSADDGISPDERKFTEMQGQAFHKVIAQLEKRGYHCPKIHLQASYGVLNYPALAGDYARVGIALYGVVSRYSDLYCLPDGLRPVLSVKARIAAVKDLLAGETAGYGFGYTASSDRKIAILTIGYADGFPRSLSGGNGHVLINGRKAPVVGYICMDQTIVDVTGIPDVKQGDAAVVIGRSGDYEITAYDLAEQSGSITNEVLSRLGERLVRMWGDGDEGEGV